MLMRLNDLLRMKAAVDDERLPVTEIFFDRRSGTLKYVALHIEDWMAESEALLHTDYFERPRADESLWPVNVNRATIENSPRWTHPHHEEEEHSLFDLSNWPPLVIGPFGSTYAPLMLQAQLAEEGVSHEDAPHPDDPDAQPRQLRGLDRASDWLDREIFGEDGSLGSLSDLLVDAAEFRVTHLIVDMPDDGERSLPLSRFRYVAKGGTHLVADTTTTRLAAAPDPEAEIKRQSAQTSHG
jgi:hypothetical protein